MFCFLKKIMLGFLVCFLLVSSSSVFAATGIVISDAERGSLEALYNSTDGANWVNNTSWMTATNECNWYGITCNLAGNSVTAISLNWNGLNGTLPAEIGNLSNLGTLQVECNPYTWTDYLTGSIPTEIGNLTNLTYLDLSYNQFSGSIPTSIGNLTNLTYLNLSINTLSGSIPSELQSLSNLLYFYKILYLDFENYSFLKY